MSGPALCRFPLRAPLLGALLAAGCTEHGLSHYDDLVGDPTPRILVEPDSLDFGSCARGETSTRTFTVTNVGDALLEVLDIRIGSANGFTRLSDPHWFLEPEQSTEIDVLFEPNGAQSSTDLAWVDSTDPVDPSVSVQLSGFGILPELTIEPNPWDFGTGWVRCGDSVDLKLKNTGYADLTITAADYTGDLASFAYTGPDLPLVLGPGRGVQARVDYYPVSVGVLSATLSVTSDDPRGVRTATQTGTAQTGAAEQDTFLVGQDVPADILFAVDQSGSMDDDQENLAANFGAFIGVVSGVTSNWHIGVVTLDGGCFNGGVLDASTADLATVFGDAVTLGDDLDIADDEALLKMTDRALQQTATGRCNEGFLRSGAALHVIVVSDEPERSHEQASAWTWDYWVPRLQAYVANPTQLRISGVVDLGPCNEGAEGYVEAIQATGGELLSICAADWSQHLVALANATLALAASFPLSEIADPASIAVTVDGSPRADWTYDAVANAVVFDQPLGAGSSVVVDYNVLLECP